MKAARPVPKSEETPDFIEFWNVWRPHMNQFDGRGDARKWFFHHIRELGADPRDMVDGARWFIRGGGNQGIGQDGKPVRIHAGSWLNKSAYEDGAEQERAYQQRSQERPQNVVAIRSNYKPKFLQEWEGRE
jgi:hypothetical protein